MTDVRETLRKEPWSKDQDQGKSGVWRKKPSNHGKKRKSVDTHEKRAGL